MPDIVINFVRRQTGSSLIEVLVAMLVLAIGLLGLAALQTQGMRFNHDAYVRTSATSLAYDIVEKMRINRGNTTLYTGRTFAAPVDSNFPARNTTTAPSGAHTVNFPPYNCTGANATVASVQTDLACWLNGVELGLPLGEAAIAQQIAPNDNLFDITIFWLDREPRDFSGVSRLAQDAAECTTNATNRTWIASAGRCFVTQTWTVWP